MKWKVESPPFGAGTRFEIEHVAADGTKTLETLVVTSITRQANGSTYTVQMERGDGMSVRGEVPPRLRYSPGARGYITTRNAKLVPVTVPAGHFLAARMWSAETLGGRSHEVDEWLVPDLPVRVQAWSRPNNAAELYDPPADAVIPLGELLLAAGETRAAIRRVPSTNEEKSNELTLDYRRVGGGRVRVPGAVRIRPGRNGQEGGQAGNGPSRSRQPRWRT